MVWRLAYVMPVCITTGNATSPGHQTVSFPHLGCRPELDTQNATTIKSSVRWSFSPSAHVHTWRTRFISWCCGVPTVFLFGSSFPHDWCSQAVPGLALPVCGTPFLLLRFPFGGGVFQRWLARRTTCISLPFTILVASLGNMGR